MAITRQQIILEVDADTGEVLKATSELQKNMEGVADAANDAAEATENIGTAGSAAGSLLKKAGRAGTTAFKNLGLAIKATGIGLLVSLLAKLVIAFTENKKVADALGLATATLGTIFNGIVEVGSKMVTTLIEAFNNPQKAVESLREKFVLLGDYMKTLLDASINPIRRGLLNIKRAALEAAIGTKEFFGGDATALKQQVRELDDQLADLVVKQEENKDKLKEPFVQAAEAVKTYVAETATAVKAATRLEKQLQKLSDAERDLAVTTAQSRAEVEELKRQRDDQTLSIEDRIAAAEKAAAIDKAIADENVRIAEQRAQLLRQEIELQGATDERLQAVADAEIAAADARTASLTVQTELQNSLFALNEEGRAQAEEAAQAELERRKELAEALATEKELELIKLREDYEAKLALAREFGEGEEQLTQEFEQKKAEIEEKYAKERVDREKVSAQEVVGTFQNAFNAIQALQQAFGTQNEKQARKNFQIQKALSLAQTTIATVEAVQNAFTTAQKSPITALFPGYPFVQAGIAGAFGAAQLAVINKSKYQGGAASPPPTPSGGGGGGVPAGGGQTQTPQLDLSFLGEGAGQEGPIQAYVVSENVSNAQQANQKIQEQASL